MPNDGPRKKRCNFESDNHFLLVVGYWLRQLQRSRPALDTESAATLLHSFVASLRLRDEGPSVADCDYGVSASCTVGPVVR